MNGTAHLRVTWPQKEHMPTRAVAPRSGRSHDGDRCRVMTQSQAGITAVQLHDAHEGSVAQAQENGPMRGAAEK